MLRSFLAPQFTNYNHKHIQLTQRRPVATTESLVSISLTAERSFPLPAAHVISPHHIRDSCKIQKITWLINCLLPLPWSSPTIVGSAPSSSVSEELSLLSGSDPSSLFSGLLSPLTEHDHIDQNQNHDKYKMESVQRERLLTLIFNASLLLYTHTNTYIYTRVCGGKEYMWPILTNLLTTQKLATKAQGWTSKNSWNLESV